jgi:hypothetical protein
MKLNATQTAPLWKVITGAGLLVGILDISDAFIFYGLHGVPPVRILQSIASGLLGRAAFTQGLRSALLGLAAHFFIAFSAAAVYLLASRRLPLSRHPLLYGTLYGLALYCVMNYLVLPLTRVAPRPPFPPLVPFVNGVAALVVCIGIPLAFIARRYTPQKFA